MVRAAGLSCPDSSSRAGVNPTSASGEDVATQVVGSGSDAGAAALPSVVAPPNSSLSERMASVSSRADLCIAGAELTMESGLVLVRLGRVANGSFVFASVLRASDNGEGLAASNALEGKS